MLEPGKDPRQRSELRGRILGQQQELGRRIADLERAKLSDADRKTLEDARAFLTQSGQAFEQGDLERSMLLAQKASLLINTLTAGH